MAGLRLEQLESIQDRITEGLNQGFGKITDRIDAYTNEVVDYATHSIFSRSEHSSIIRTDLVISSLV